MLDPLGFIPDRNGYMFNATCTDDPFAYQVETCSVSELEFSVLNEIISLSKCSN